MMERAKVEIADHAPHVLVVDDDRRLRELLARFLGEHGYRVTTAASAAEARAKGEALVFDAIVLDVMMPGETGFDYARRLRTQSQVPILMLTARAELGRPGHRARDRRRRLPAEALRAARAGAAPRQHPAGARSRATPQPARRWRRRRSASARSASASTAASSAAATRSIRITEREREILSILGHRAAGERAARRARRRRQRRERAHRRRADQPPAPQDRDRSGKPGLSADRARGRLPPARRLMLMRLPASLPAGGPLRPLRALARLGPAEGALRALADHHHRAGGPPPIRHRLCVHGAALADRDPPPVRGRDRRHRGADRHLRDLSRRTRTARRSPASPTTASTSTSISCPTRRCRRRGRSRSSRSSTRRSPRSCRARSRGRSGSTPSGARTSSRSGSSSTTP